MFSRAWWRAVVATGLVAGTCDALGATVHYLANGGRTPLRIWTYVASAVFGPEAQAGGAPIMLSGLGFHYLIALTWAALYFVLAVRLRWLRTLVVPSAVLYGAFVWTIMNLLVVPNTRIPPRPFNGTQASIAAVVLMVCIGVPCAVGARRFFGTSDART
jgi:hypothetical protein